MTLTEADFRGLRTAGRHAETWGREWGWFPVGAATPYARMRRGRWVMIPAEWRGKTVFEPTKRKRQDRRRRKRARSKRRRVHQ